MANETEEQPFDLTKTQPGIQPPVTPSEAARLFTLGGVLRKELAVMNAHLSAYLTAEGHSTHQTPPLPAPHKALTAGNAAKWFLIANGALAIAGEVASLVKPELVGPLQALGKLLGGLL